MLSSARKLGALAILAGACLFVLLAQSSARATATGDAAQPAPGAWYVDGPSGRYLLGGAWLYRADDGSGLTKRYEDSRSTSGWRVVSVPNAWNADDPTAAGYAPSVGWYRKDFRLPAAAATTWIVRFESVNDSATIWLNGHEIATHSGAFLPFEVVLPASDLDQRGLNRLVLRISDANSLTGLPPLSEAGPKGVAGGWWNYGGILREVYLRAVDDVDFASVQVLPRLPCARCAAEIDYSVVLHNYAATARRVALRTSYGGVVAALGTRTLAAGAEATFTGALRIASPQLWSPSSPHLYAVTIDAASGAPGGRLSTLSRYTLQSGIRAVNVIDGQLYLNYEPLHVRGVGLIEDSPTDGSALDRAQQRQLIVNAKSLGATMIRSQYPLSAYEEQLADQLGIMLWSEIPAYQIRDTELRALTPAAVAELRANILDNGNHPSIVVWSVANELDPLVGPSQTAYIAATVRAAHALDPTRPVGLAFQGYPQIGCQAGYGPLQVLGVNDYFGWYAGPSGEIADISELTGYLDQERACYPHKALIVSEFGAEANRDGPVDERGTYQFQSQFITTQLDAFDAIPWLSGALYWALQDFLVWPGWSGGNPYPAPPTFFKGLYSAAGVAKPAVAVVQQAFRATQQIG